MHLLPLITVLAALALPGLSSAAQPLRFAPLPMVDKETMVREFLGPVRYMAEQSGQTIDLVHTASYEELIERFRRDEIDLAYIGPLPYLMLTQDFDAAQPVVRFLESNGQDGYTCALVVFGDSPLYAAGMRGRRLALPDPLSTCGLPSIGPMLREAGVAPADTQLSYLGRHDAVAIAVVANEADAGGLKTAIARKYASLGLRIVAESPPVPGFVLIANRHTVPEGIVEHLREGLLKLPKTSDATHGWNNGWRYGAVPSADADFDPLRARWAQEPARK